jgi:hypothetical protein
MSDTIAVSAVNTTNSANSGVANRYAAKEYSFHPISNMFPLLEGGEFAALVEDIRAHGLQQEITLYEEQILDGRNRYRACAEAGVEPHYREFIGSHADAVAYVISANIHRRHLNAEQRRELIEKLLKANPEQSDRQITQTAKVDHKTVGAIRRKAEGRGEIPHVEKRADSKGRSQPARKAGAKSKTATPSAHSAVTYYADVDTAASAEERRAYYADDGDAHDGAGAERNGNTDDDDAGDGSVFERTLEEVCEWFKIADDDCDEWPTDWTGERLAAAYENIVTALASLTRLKERIRQEIEVTALAALPADGSIPPCLLRSKTESAS